MAEDSSQERTEDATPKRRQDARKKGTVAKSADLTSALVLLALLLTLPAAISILGHGFVQGFTAGLREMPKDVTAASIGKFCYAVAQPSLGGLALVMAVALIIGVACTTAQVGFVISGEALTPNFGKLNPLEGFKRLLSVTFIFDAAKALFKSCLFGLVAWLVISASWSELAGLGWIDPRASLAATGGIARSMGIKIVFLWLAMAGLDYFFQKKRVDKMLRMSKQEIKQEMKQNEQSPELRGAMARRRRQMARGRMMQNLLKADVVITNPTHYAIALQYDSKAHTAPLVVAKGADFLAAKIREVAKEHEIPIVPNPPLARALYKQCELGDAVPRDLFQPVAEVLAFVYRTIKKVRAAA